MSRRAITFGLVALAAGVCAYRCGGALVARARCLVTRHHDPARTPLGGFRCRLCGFVGVDLDAMGYGIGAGWVAPMRKVFNRERREVTRTSAWAPSERGW